MANTIDSVTQAYLKSLSSSTGNQSSQSTGLTGSSFTQLLSGLMTSNSLSMLGDFSGTSSGSSDYMNSMMGSSLLGGLGGTSSSSDSGMMTMLLMMLLLQNSNNTSNNTPGTAADSSTQSMACQHVYAYPASNYEKQGIPSDASLPSNPPITNSAGERNPSLYRAIINQFDVENNIRYQNNKNGVDDTYCNIFAWDVTRAMGAEIPHYVDAATGIPAIAGNSNAVEMNANQVNDWLNTNGTSYGWVKATPEQAQEYANMGMPAVTSWKNPSGHGHLQVVSPSTDGQYDATRGVAIAQAGSQLVNYGYASSVYSADTLSQIEYFVHI